MVGDSQPSFEETHMQDFSILVVDDITNNLEIVSRRLAEKGYQVHSAHSGLEAAQIALRERPDLILMDLVMPGFSGWASMKVLRERKETAMIPVVALSATILETDEGKLQAAGFSDWCAKPIKMKQLVEKIPGWLLA